MLFQDPSIEESEQAMDDMPQGMNRKSTFYDLPYWKDLLICHLLDPMHILKNVTDSIYRHISAKIKTLYIQEETLLFHVPNLIEDICGQIEKMKLMQKLHGF